MSPQVLGQALVSRVRLGRENSVGQLVLQPTASPSQAVLGFGRMDIGNLRPGWKGDGTKIFYGASCLAYQFASSIRNAESRFEAPVYTLPHYASQPYLARRRRRSSSNSVARAPHDLRW